MNMLRSKKKYISYIYIYIYIYVSKLLTVVEGDPKAPFSIGATPIYIQSLVESYRRLKRAPDASLLNTQNCEVRIKGSFTQGKE